MGDLRVRRDAVPAHSDNGGAERGDAGLSDGAAGAVSAGDLQDDARLLDPSAGPAAHVRAAPHAAPEVQRAMRERWRERWRWRRRRRGRRPLRRGLGSSSFANSPRGISTRRPARDPSRECAFLPAAGASHSTRFYHSCHRTAAQPLRPPEFRHCQPTLTDLQYCSVNH